MLLNTFINDTLMLVGFILEGRIWELQKFVRVTDIIAISLQFFRLAHAKRASNSH